MRERTLLSMAGAIIAAVEASTMPEVDRLRELHDMYAWEVNAAIAEGREDLVWKLADDYLERAMRLMTEEHAGCCQCATCTEFRRRSAAAPALARRRRWQLFRPLG
jgi:hypothetical protein